MVIGFIYGDATTLLLDVGANGIVESYIYRRDYLIEKFLFLSVLLESEIYAKQKVINL